MTDRQQEAGASASSGERVDAWALDRTPGVRRLRSEGEAGWRLLGPAWKWPYLGLEERVPELPSAELQPVMEVC